MRRRDADGLDPGRGYWIPVVVAPERDWPGAPGCHRGARFIVHRETLRASRDEFEAFESRLSCLQWIMDHRAELNRALPHASIQAVRLDRWLLGLD